MIKLILYFILTLTSIASFAQPRTEVFTIDADRTNPLKLSDIAEKVTAIPLDKNISLVQGAFWTGEYLFIASLKEVWQYNASGKFIRTIPCNGQTIRSITGNLSMKELYVAVNASDDKCEIRSYDYSGKMKRKLPLKKPSVVSILFHNDALWVLSEEAIGKSTRGYYSYIDLSGGKETFLKETVENPPSVNPSGQSYRRSFVATLSTSNNCLYANWGDEVMWRIKTKKAEQAYKCHVKQKYRNELISLKGIIGNYLFFKYHLNDDDSNLYLRHLTTGNAFNVKYKGNYGDYTQGAVEDIYQSGYFDFNKTPLTQEGYFWFIKTMEGKPLKGEAKKSGLVAFIVKTKK